MAFKKRLGMWPLPLFLYLKIRDTMNEKKHVPGYAFPNILVWVWYSEQLQTDQRFQFWSWGHFTLCTESQKILKIPGKKNKKKQHILSENK